MPIKLSLPKILSALTLSSSCQDSSKHDSLRRAWAHACSVQRTGRAGIEQTELQAQLTRTVTRHLSTGCRDWKKRLLMKNRKKRTGKRKEQTQEAREWVTWFLRVTLSWEWGWNRKGVARKSLTTSNVFTMISYHMLASRGWTVCYTNSQNLKARESPWAAFKRSSVWRWSLPFFLGQSQCGYNQPCSHVYSWQYLALSSSARQEYSSWDPS